MSDIQLNNSSSKIVKIEQVDESWALELLNEAEKEAAEELIFVEEPILQDSLEDGKPEGPTAIELQILRSKDRQEKEDSLGARLKVSQEENPSPVEKIRQYFIGLVG